MKEVNEHISPEFPSGKILLPLHEFYAALRQNNFLITPGQIIDVNRIISQFAGTLKSEEELCIYMSPVFANSQKEQIQFKQIFEEFFIEKEVPVSKKIIKEKTDWKSHFIKHRWKYFFAAVAIIGAIIIIKYLLYTPTQSPTTPKISLNYQFADADTIGLKKPAPQRTQIKVVANPGVNRKVPSGITLKTKLNWGDGSPVDSLNSHIYTQEGNYIAAAYTNVFYKNELQYTDTTEKPVGICFNPVPVVIQKSFEGDSIKTGEKFTLKAIIKRKTTDSVYWSNYDQDNFIDSKNNELTASVNTDGVQTFNYNAFYGNKESPCNVKSQISFTVYDPNPKPQVTFQPSANATPLQLKYKVYAYWFYILSVAVAVSLFLFAFFVILWRRSKNKKDIDGEQSKEQYDTFLRSFSGKTGSADIPLQNKNYLPLPEQELSIVARLMRLRISDEASYMDVRKTIDKAMLNAGFFYPVMAARTQQSEFLVLIDEDNSNNQLVKLFDFLVDLLKKQNVYIDKFYYRAEPGYCYNENEVNGISLEKLSEKFPEHILLIFGNAYQVIYPLYPIIDQDYMQLLNRWQYKAVMTPVPFLDWGNKEKKVLLPELPVFPVDMPGLLLMMHKLFGEEMNILSELQQFSNDFYDTDIVDFEDLDEIQDYCSNAKWANISKDISYSNILFQWIAAIAVYPKIKWELIIAIGKAILEKYGYPHELNFTNLLFIARISWMKAGHCPDYTRLNLLKVLTVENEIIARETILSVLAEIPVTELNEGHLAFEEKETQRIINEFNLYANNPVKYAGYKNSKDLFVQLNQDSLVMDTTAKAYLENSSSSWETLINKPVIENDSIRQPANIPLSSYLVAKPTENKRSPLTKIYLRTAVFSFILFIGSLIALIALIVLNSSDKKSGFTYKEPLYTSVEFSFTDSAFSKLAGNVLLNVDTLQTALNNLKKSALLLNITDTVKNILISKNGTVVFDTTLDINYDAYDIAFASNVNNITEASYCNADETKCGSFKLITGGKWNEKNQDGSFDWNEISRSNNQIHLRAADGRNYDIILDLESKQIKLSTDGGKSWSVLYTIKSISNSATNKTSEIAHPNLTNGTWVIHNAIDINNTDWSNSALKFTSQTDTATGLILSGTFSWNDKSVLMGTEKFKGYYLDKNRTINLTGISLSNVNKAANQGYALVLGTYSAVLSGDENKLSEGTFGSADNLQFDKLKDKWNATRETSFIQPTNPVVSIYVSSDSLIISANAFKKQMEKNGFKVNAIAVKNYNYNSDIYYYNKTMQDKANAIQKIFNKYYPALKVQAHIKNTNNQAQYQNAIIIWIKQLQVPDINGLTIKQIQYKGNGSAKAGGVVTGEIYLNPTNNSWEEYNNDPQNKGVAKKLILGSRDQRFINLFSSNDKVEIRIDLVLKKIYVGKDEFYDVISTSNQLKANTYNKKMN